MSLLEKNTSCPLFTLPQELKDIIWDHVLNLRRPIHLVSTEEIRKAYMAKHQTPTHLHIPPSVLAARLVCRAMRDDMGAIFWQINDFHFETSLAAYLASTTIYFQFAQEIRKMTFRFTSSGAPAVFRGLPVFCPNVDTLRVVMHYDDTHLVYHKRGARAKKILNSALKRTSGVGSLRRSFTTLKTLQVFGVDMIKLPDLETNKLVWTEVDVNHPDAVGPWLQAAMVAPPRPKQPFV